MVTTTIDKWGNSAAIRIPQDFLESAHLALGTKVEIQVLPDQGILVKPVDKRMRKTNRELRSLYLSKRGKNKPEMSQDELLNESVGEEW